MSPLTIEQFIALNQEIAMLVRAGVPLDRGLVELGGELPTGLRQKTDAIAAQISAGRALSEVLSDPRYGLPDAYRAILEAGARSGQLTVALEGMVRVARRTAELQRLTRLAFIYPLLLIVLAYSFFVYLLLNVLPQFAALYREGRMTPGTWLRWTDHLATASPIWIWWLPLVVFVALAGCWWRSPNSRQLLGPTSVWLRTSPAAAQALMRTSLFADLLALLIEHHLPLAEALRLAGESSGDAGLKMASSEAAESVRRGDVRFSAKVANRLPPLIAWLLASQSSQGAWGRSLRRAAQTYQQRAQRIVDWLSIYLPILLAVTIGGGAVCVYLAAFLWPFVQMLNDLFAL